MLKKTITYEDFNGETVSEDFFFHLSKAELVELELSKKGGLSESLKSIIASEDGKAIISEFKNIILGAYGKRSPDGKRFVKNQSLREEFESTEAYSTLFMELVTNAESAAEFINGIIPTGMAEEVAKLTTAEAPSQESDTAQGPLLAAVPESTVVTRQEINEMSPEDFKEFGMKLARGEVVLDES